MRNRAARASRDARSTTQGIVFILCLSIAASVSLVLADKVGGPDRTSNGANGTIPPRFAVIDLGTNFFPVGLNASNVVVGNSAVDQPEVWNSGTITPLSTNYPDAYWFEVSGITDSGLIVGGLTFSWFSVECGCYWTNASSTPVLLGYDEEYDGSFREASENNPTAVSGDGFIAGYDTGGELVQYSPTFTESNGTNYCVPLVDGDDGYIAVANGDNWCAPVFALAPDGTLHIISIVNGTYISAFPDLSLEGINSNGICVGWDYSSGTDQAEVFTTNGVETPIGPGEAMAINSHVIGTGTSTIPDPQIIGTDTTYPNVLFWDHTSYAGSPTSTYTEKQLDRLLPGANGTHAPPWHITGTPAMNDSGAIVGTATYSGTNTAIAAGSHGVMLLPLQFVREYPPGSGNFQPILDNGLDDKAQLPIYTTEDGTGRAMSWSNLYTFTAQLSANLTGTSTASMTVAFQNSRGTFSGTLTETSAGSGVFTNTGSTFTVTLSPTTQTTSSTTVDTLNVTVTDSTLGLNGSAFTLQETAANSNSLAAVTAQTVVTLSGALSPTAVNTIQLSLEETGGSQDFVTTLTETAVNSRVFQDASGTTLTMNGYTGGTNMNVAASSTVAGRVPVPLFTASLTETSGSSLQFVNYLVTIGNVTPSTPETNGQCVFYVQFPGSVATSITLVSGSNSVTTTASPVSGQPNLLRTGKLVLLTPNDPFTAADITTLTVSPPSGGGNPTVQLQMYGQTIVDPGSAYLAYAGECASDSHFATPAAHLSDIQSILTSGLSTSPGYAGSPGLGWGCSVPDQAMTLASVKAAIPTHNLWYSYSHGLTTTPDAPPFKTFQVWPGSNGANPWNYGQAEISPGDVALANNLHAVGGVPGNNTSTQEYQLVFLNSCFSADQSNPGSLAGAFITAFNADSYVGWSYDQKPAGAASAAEVFFQALVGKTKAVSDGVAAVKQQIDANPSFYVTPNYGVNGGNVAESFVALKGPNVVIQK